MPGVTCRSKHAFFHEFVIQLDNDSPAYAEAVLNNMAEQGILAGYNLSEYGDELKNCILVCVTEVKTDNDLVLYQSALARAMKEVASAC
jgi:glycine dehydrogenase subunit 1